MVSKKKKKELEKLKKIFESYNSILLFDLAQLPSRQLHHIREKLKSEEIYTLVSKKSIIDFALKDKKFEINLDDMKQPAIIYSNKDIFEVAKKIRKLKVNRKAKPGETSPIEIFVPDGDTGIPAGPAISIFKQFKIPTQMQKGKITIKQPTKICEAGQEISLNLVSLLNMLNVEPIEIQVMPEKGYFYGNFYGKDVLKLDEEYFKQGIVQITNNVFKLTSHIGYPTEQNIESLIQRAGVNMRKLGLKLRFPNKDLLPDLMKTAKINADKLNEQIK